MEDFLIAFALDRIFYGSIGAIALLAYKIIPIMISIYFIYHKYSFFIKLIRGDKNGS